MTQQSAVKLVAGSWLESPVRYSVLHGLDTEKLGELINITNKPRIE